MPRRLSPADPGSVAAALDRFHTAAADAAAAGTAGTAGTQADAADVKLLVKHFLAVLSAAAPGRSVEVRVPPYAAVQCVPGSRHTRGTPPGVVELDPIGWIRLAIGKLTWSDAVESGLLVASGERTDLSGYLPLHESLEKSSEKSERHGTELGSAPS